MQKLNNYRSTNRKKNQKRALPGKKTKEKEKEKGRKTKEIKKE